jgi:excisionase family DNA binding protein
VDEHLWTETEAAEYLRVHVATLRRWRAEGTGPPWLRAGRSLRYRRADVDDWLRQQRAEQENDS